MTLDCEAVIILQLKFCTDKLQKQEDIRQAFINCAQINDDQANTIFTQFLLTYPFKDVQSISDCLFQFQQFFRYAFTQARCVNRQEAIILNFKKFQ
ncbi:hypothetical protein FGO68_gene16547 [Halteria grandinella]|uniref:Uncharacterized protein n=1 Tax=Halteria grandinella TaxID=5974 RepID=A0A8J8T0B5_HALGN|nr:hypothetical protein FGO68_gene16547 [Halteria grandinella]